MSTDELLSARVAEEIRAMLARKGINKSELARRLNVSHTWVTNRLAGHQDISLNEMDRIARVLDVPLTDLLPATVRPNNRSSDPAVRLTSQRRRVTSRPKGRPEAAGTRPTRTERPTERRPKLLDRPMSSR